MAILAVANRVLDFDSSSGTPVDVTTAGSFDPAYVTSAIQFNSDDANVTKLFAGAGAITWFTFTFTRVGSSSASGVYADAIVISDASGNEILRAKKRTLYNNEIYFTLTGATSVETPYFNHADGGDDSVTYTFRVDMSGAGIDVKIFKGSKFPAASHTLSVPSKGTRGFPASIFLRPRAIAYTNGGTLRLTELIIGTTSTLGSRLIAKYPATVGDYSDFAGTLADLSTDNPATGLTATASGRHSWGSLPAFAGVAAPLDALVANVFGNHAGGTPDKLAPMIRSGGVNYDGVALSVPSSFRLLQTWTTNPITGLRWTTADLAGLQLGLKAS